MKAISLWQPWATAIALGYKTFETRHWSTYYRGPIAIHAAKRWTRDEREFAQSMAYEFDDQRLAQPPLGVIVATATLTSILRCDIALRLTVADCHDGYWGNYADGRFAWKLTDVHVFAEPITFRGAQGLFDVPDALLDGAA